MKNKIISLSLITSLLCQSSAMAIQIGNSGPLENALSNFTPAKMTESKDSTGKVIKTNYYSGGYYFRFSNESYPQPLWQVSPPSIEAGCNGFNMKGMFVSILGLDQFGAMLQNAGAALAWGIAIGLIYSLPGVAAAFKMINQWAQEIQKLLSMACSSGMAIGQAIGKKVGDQAPGILKDVDQKIADNLSPAGVASHFQDGKKAVSDAFGSLDLGLSASWDTGITFSGKDSVPEAKRSLIMAEIGKIFADYSVGGSIYSDFLKRSPQTRTFLNDKIKTPVNSPVFYNLMTITYSQDHRAGAGSDFVNSGANSIPTFEESIVGMQTRVTAIEDKNVYGFKMLSYILFYNLVGDYGYGLDSVNSFVNDVGKAFSCSSASSGAKPANCGSTQDNDKKIMDALTQATTISQVKPTFVGDVRPANGKQLLDFVLKGVTLSTDKKDFKAPTFLIVGERQDASSLNYNIIPTNPVDQTKAFNNGDFAGMEKIAKCSLFKALKNKISPMYYQDLENTYDDNKTATKMNCDIIAPNPILLPGIDLYTDILYKATETEISTGVQLLKDVNVYLSTLNMLDNLTQNISTSMIGSRKLSNKAATEQVIAQLQSTVPGNERPNLDSRLTAFYESIKDARATLQDQYRNVLDGQEKIDIYFRFLKDEIAKRSLEKQK